MSLNNRLRLGYNYFLHRPRASNGPVEIGIEITNRCNLNCRMCNRQEMTRPLGNIRWDLFRRIVDQTKSNAEIYNLFGLGEPLLHPQLMQMIDYCHSCRVPVAVSTNTTLLNSANIRRLLARPPDYLLLALPAHHPGTYLSICRRRFYHRCRINLKRYLRARRRLPHPPHAVVLFVQQPLNQTESTSFLKYWQNQGAPDVYLKKVTAMTELKPQARPPGSCLFPWRTINFTWQGDAFPCCQDTNCSFKLGNIRRSSLESIWNGRDWQRLRSSFAAGRQTSLCRSCLIRKPSPLLVFALTLIPELSAKKAVSSLSRYRRLFSRLFQS